MRTIAWIAINVFRESVRDKVLYNLVLFAILMMGASYLLGQLTAGQDYKIVLDLGLAAMSFFGLFIAVFIGIGLVPDAGGTWFVHRLLGFAKAFEWMSSNRRLSAAEALDWGLVSGVIPDDAFAARVAELAAEWAERPTLAIGRTKQLFEHAFTAELDAQLALEARLQQECVGTADFAEGVGAFLEKRAPRFTGT